MNNFKVLGKLDEEDRVALASLNDMQLGSNSLLQQLVGGLQNLEQARREHWAKLAEKYDFDPTDSTIHVQTVEGELRKIHQPERIDYIAEFAHEINRAYCRAIGDDSQPAWSEAPQWQKSSAKQGVLAHLNDDLTPEESHESWMKQKEAEGWIWGPIKNETAKTHPCFTAYENLSAEHRAKDYLFKAVCELFKRQQ